MRYQITIEGPGAEQAKNELLSNAQYDSLDVQIYIVELEGD